MKECKYAVTEVFHFIKPMRNDYEERQSSVSQPQALYNNNMKVTASPREAPELITTFVAPFAVDPEALGVPEAEELVPALVVAADNPDADAVMVLTILDTDNELTVLGTDTDTAMVLTVLDTDTDTALALAVLRLARVVVAGV